MGEWGTSHQGAPDGKEVRQASQPGSCVKGLSGQGIGELDRPQCRLDGTMQYRRTPQTGPVSNPLVRSVRRAVVVVVVCWLRSGTENELLSFRLEQLSQTNQSIGGEGK